MKRSELISKAQELNLAVVAGRPVVDNNFDNFHTIEIQRAVQELLPKGTSPRISIKSRILELHQEGLSKKAIETKMLEEGITRIRYQYIDLVVKQHKETTPEPVVVEPVKTTKKAQVQ
jgi:hypothetical protein